MINKPNAWRGITDSTEAIWIGEEPTITAPVEQLNIKTNPLSNPVEYGWVCPKCGRANAPWTLTCDCSQKQEVTY